jgi:hypothetical protein
MVDLTMKAYFYAQIFSAPVGQATPPPLSDLLKCFSVLNITNRIKRSAARARLFHEAIRTMRERAILHLDCLSERLEQIKNTFEFCKPRIVARQRCILVVDKSRASASARSRQRRCGS